jgi:hypothetical protein
VRGGDVGGESGKLAVASGCSPSLEIGTTGEGSRSLRARSLGRCIALGGLMDWVDSLSRSMSRDGIDSDERDRNEEDGLMPLLLVKLDASVSKSTLFSV